MLEAIIFFLALSSTVYSLFGYIVWLVRMIKPYTEQDSKQNTDSKLRYNIFIWITCILWSVLYYLSHT